MFGLYTLLIQFIEKILPLTAIFSSKMTLFVNGRKEVMQQLTASIAATDDVVWFHAASLGEFEQGIPVMERFKKEFPTYKMVVTFFSPSGYEVRKNNSLADVTVYLPLDTPNNVHRFLDVVRPKQVFFIKYEFWPNYLKALAQRKIPTYLISGIFRDNQIFFKPYGGFYRKALQHITHFFVQNESSKKLLQSIGFQNVTLSGDTRFDRVQDILRRDNRLAFMDLFAKNSKIIVLGSSWPVDEDLFMNFINQSDDHVKFVIAPHENKPEKVQRILKGLHVNTMLYSKIEINQIANQKVLIIDTIGILTKIYSYADLAYVGGGFGQAGLHNILEPATFGIPVIIGPNYSKFTEAVALVEIGGCRVVQHEKELSETLHRLLQNQDERHEMGHICETFTQMNAGATDTIFNHLI